jgi:RNA polymerase sigma-70 factor, ECF subfamily
VHPEIGAEGHALDDEQVVARVLAGELALFEILMRRHNQRLYRIARSIVRNDLEAEDVVQQAYLAAYANLAQFAGVARFSTWLTRIGINEALARTRLRARRAEVELEEQESMDPEEPSPEDLVANREHATLLEAAIDELPQAYRVVFMMREVQELSVAETAECLGLSEENVKVRLHRARAMLRELLAARMERATREAFPFLGARCDRIVRAVMAELGRAGSL